MPPAAADLRPAVPHLAAAQQRAADRGRSLPRRPADHAGRRRVHHQRRRARRGEPVASQPRYRLRFRNGSGRAPAVQLPRHSRARKLDRNQHDEEGQHHRPHRPERQVLGDDAAAGDGPEVRAGCRHPAHVLRNDQAEDHRRPQRRQDRRQGRRRRHRLPGRQRSGRRDHRRKRPEDHQDGGRNDLRFRPQVGRDHGAAGDAAVAQRAGRRRHVEP